jgi:glutaredoxin
MFCAQVAALLSEAGIPFRTIDVPDRTAQDALVERYDARAFPLVLVDRAYIGGFTHMVRLHSQGRLRSIASDDEQPAEAVPENPAMRPRLPSSGSLRAGEPAPAAEVTARAGGTLADFAKLGEYLQRMKKT